MRKICSILSAAGFLAVLVLLVAALVAQADPALDSLSEQMKRTIPGVKEVRFNPTPISGIVEVLLDNNEEILYATTDGRFVLQGRIIDLKAPSGQPEDISASTRKKEEDKRKSSRRQVLSELRQDRFIDFGLPEAKYDAVVLTDVNCGYCRKFHSKINEYNDAGIRVRYLLTPILGEKSLENATSVWCADDRATALDHVKKGIPIPKKECNTPIDGNLALAKSMGLRGTPGIVLEDGTFIGGYVEPKDLLKAIKQTQADSAAKR